MTADLFEECKFGAVNQNASSRGPGLPWLYSRSSVKWLKSRIHWGTWLSAVVIKSDFCSLNPELLSSDKWKNSRSPCLFQFQGHWSSAWSSVEELCWPGHSDSSFSVVHFANNILSLEIMCCLLSPRRQDPIFSVKQETLLEGGGAPSHPRPTPQTSSHRPGGRGLGMYSSWPWWRECPWDIARGWVDGSYRTNPL